MSNSTPRNLLLVSNYPSDTAYAWWLMEHFWASIADHFSTPEHTVFLAYPEVTTVPEIIKSTSIKVVELTIPWKTSSQSSHARQFIREKNISLIYFTDQRYFNFQYAMMRYQGVQQIIVHDHTPGDRPSIGGLKGALKAAKNTLPWITADRVLCVSPLMRKRNITNARIPKHKCLVVQNGIQPVTCKTNNKASIKESIGISDKSLLVTTTGRADPYKRFDFIIETARQLKIQSPKCDVIFLLVGDGPAMPDLRKQIHDNKLQDTVILLGFRTNVRDILCASDIAFHAAMGEGFSLSIIEYMSAGLPVLVPDTPSVCQAITHGLTGMIYKKDDAKMSASYIAKLANNEKQRVTMGNAAQAEANENYTLEQCTHSFIDTIKNIYQLNT